MKLKTLLISSTEIKIDTIVYCQNCYGVSDGTFLIGGIEIYNNFVKIIEVWGYKNE